MARQLRVAVAGLGGFAGAHHEAIRALEAQGVCRLAAVCDPLHGPEREAAARFGLDERGVRHFPGLDSMLAGGGPFDVVTLPTPIPLHAEQHRQVVESGAACYLEKPPTLSWPEFRGMLEVESRAARATHVGFNFVGDPLRRGLKARLLDGEFGRVLGASMLALWPRDRAYYRRSDWAGRMSLGGRPVMDSPAGNAVSHFVQDLLFFCGEGEIESAARVAEVQASLFRAHPIESFDTSFITATLVHGPWIRIGVTHTGLGAQADRETVVCERATVVFEGWGRGRIEHANGRVEEFASSLDGFNGVVRENLARYFAYVRGEHPRPVTRLSDCAGFVELHHLAFVSSGTVEDFPAAEVAWDETEGRVEVPGLEDRLRRFVEAGNWPDGREPRSAVPAELDHAG